MYYFENLEEFEKFEKFEDRKMTRKSVEFYILLKDFKKIREILKSEGLSVKEYKKWNCHSCNKGLNDNDSVKFKIFIKNDVNLTKSEGLLLEFYCEDCVKNLLDKKQI